MDIVFTDYDRITDRLLWLSSQVSLSFTVSLASKDKFENRKSFYFETKYPSRDVGTDIGRGVKRNINFFYTIESGDFANNMVLRPHDVYFLSYSIENTALPWFFGDKRIYKIIDNKLVISGKFNPLVYQPNEYNYLIITPIVFQFGAEYKEGVRIEINNKGIYVDIDIDKFIDFYMILKNTDMYNAACNLINFIKIPPYGVNIFEKVGLGGGGNPDEGWNQAYKEEKKSNDFLDRKKR